MKNFINSLLTILFVFGSFMSWAQTGETSVFLDATENYTPGTERTDGVWILKVLDGTNGYVAVASEATKSNESTSSVDVTWSEEGSFSLAYGRNFTNPLGGTTFLGEHTFYVTVTELVIDVPTITATNECGYTRLTHDGVQSGVTFKWKVPGSANYSSTATQLDVTDAGTYYVKGFHASGEGTEASQAVTINPEPNTGTGVAVSDVSYCSGATPVGAVITVLGSNANDTYYLYKSDNSFVTSVAGSITSVNFGRQPKGTYKVKVGNGSCDEELLDDDVTVTEVSDAVSHRITTGSTALSYCTDAVTFTAEDADQSSSFQWKVNGVAAGTNSDTFTPSAIHAGANQTITVKYKIKAPCSNALVEATGTYAGVQLIAPKTPILNFSPNGNGTVCKGSTVPFSFTVSNASDYSFEWNTGETSLQGIDRVINANNTKTNVTVTVNDACASPTSLFKEVTHNIRPAPNTTSPYVAGDNYCSEESGGNITVQNPTSSDIYYLYLGNEELDDEAGTETNASGSVEFDVFPSGTYTVKVATALCPNVRYNLTTSAVISVTQATTWYYDFDGDGYHYGTQQACSDPGAYWVANSGGTDCDDDDDAINPGTTWYNDSDGDNYWSESRIQCTSPGSGWSTNSENGGGDCSTNPNINPGTVWYQDADGDNYYSSTVTQCATPSGTGWSRNAENGGGDCNDGNASIHPGLVWYYDGDGDGYGSSTTKTQCSRPANYVSNNTDCDDIDAAKHTVMDCNTQDMAPLNTGTFLEFGQSHTFTWLDETGGTMGYHVYLGGEQLNDGTPVYGNAFPWTPNFLVSNERVRVESTVQDRAFVSEPLSIVQPISVSIDKSKYYSGQTIDVSWTGGYSPINYKVELFDGTTELPTYEQSVSGSPAQITLPTPPPTGTNFTVKVSQNAANNLNGIGMDISTVFTIYKPIKVTYPVGGETFVFGEEVNITWEGEDETSSYNVYVLDGETVAETWSNVSGTSLNPDWTVTKSVTDVGNNYKVKIEQSSYSDESDTPFSIDFPDATAMAPNNGEILVGGTSYLLSWSGSVTANYEIYLDGFSNTTVPGTGTLWSIPSQAGLNRKIRVESQDGVYVSESGNFEIADQLVISNVAPSEMRGKTLFLNWTGGTATLDYRLELIRDGNILDHIYVGAGKSFDYLLSEDLELGTGYELKLWQNSELTTVVPFEVIECTPILAPNSDKNYIKTFVARHPLKECMAGANDPNLVQESIAYVDGLGRPIQQIAIAASPNGLDWVSGTEFDDYGRALKQYLPYAPDFSAATRGSFRGDWKTEQVNYLDQRFGGSIDKNYGFGEQVVEISPLNRPLKTAAPGQVWSTDDGTHLVENTYLINDINDFIPEVHVNDLNEVVIATNTYYAAGELAGIKVTDENNGNQEGETISWTNKAGQTVLKAVKIVENNVVNYMKTLYGYDEFSNLRFVVQPQGVKLIEDGVYTWSDLSDPGFQEKWMFTYEYDHRQRMIAKSVPGADTVQMIYDNRDRLVMTRDGNQNLDEFRTSDITLNGATDPIEPNYEVFGAKITLQTDFHFSAASGGTFRAKANPPLENGGWTFTKYDELNRPVMTGQIDRLANYNGIVGEVMQYHEGGGAYSESYTGAGPLFGYTNSAYPFESNEGVNITPDDLLTVTFYDDYSFTSEPLPNGAIARVTGQATGSKTRVLGTDTWLTSTTYYDERYRVIKTVSENYLLGIDSTRIEYWNAISGLVTKTTTHHTGGEPITIVEEHTYDHMDRLLTTTHSINGAAPELIASHTYNKMGELIEKNVGGSPEDVTPIQSIDYDYNIRGWLTRINNGTLLDAGENDQFGMQLSYHDATGFEQYNGNIGTMSWKSEGGSGLITTSQHYDFTYDAVSRLKTASYRAAGAENAASNVEGIAYDYNGNIMALARKQRLKTFDGAGTGTYGTFTIDDLTYYYSSGNQLSKVTDSGASNWLFANDHDKGQVKSVGFKDGVNLSEEYIYDDNGNMTKDLNKEISSITYNYLNLPEVVNTKDDQGNPVTITYSYDATGIKLRKTVLSGSNTTTTDYVGGMHFINNTLSFLQHGSGRVVKNDNAFEYEYNLTDHLGNVRATVAIGDNGVEVVQRDDYYPFGLVFNHWNKSTQGGGESFYKYNGKEEQKETGWLDYGMRHFDPTIGRFFNVDPLQDVLVYYSPYHYALNNPILLKDKDGAFPELPPWVDRFLSFFGLNPLEQPKDAQDAASLSMRRKMYSNVRRKVNKAHEYQKEVYSYLPGGQILNDIFDVSQGNMTGGEAAVSMTTNAALDYIGGKVIGKAIDWASPLLWNSFKTIFKNIRSTPGVKSNPKKGNVAFAVGDIEGEDIRLLGFSGQKELGVDGAAHLPENPIFETFEVHFDRAFDSERKILEVLAAKLKDNPNAKGEITLVSERVACESCQDVLRQFQEQFVNVRVNLVSGTNLAE